LKRVLGIMTVSQHAPTHSKDQWAVPPDDFLEGRLVRPAYKMKQQLMIRDSSRWLLVSFAGHGCNSSSSKRRCRAHILPKRAEKWQPFIQMVAGWSRAAPSFSPGRSQIRENSEVAWHMSEYCKSCRERHPGIRKLQGRFADGPFEVLAVMVDHELEPVNSLFLSVSPSCRGFPWAVRAAPFSVASLARISWIWTPHEATGHSAVASRIRTGFSMRRSAFEAHTNSHRAQS
jgi:hypothetical protein